MGGKSSKVAIEDFGWNYESLLADEDMTVKQLQPTCDEYVLLRLLINTEKIKDLLARDIGQRKNA